MKACNSLSCGNNDSEHHRVVCEIVSSHFGEMEGDGKKQKCQSFSNCGTQLVCGVYIRDDYGLNIAKSTKTDIYENREVVHGDTCAKFGRFWSEGKL